jgi:hypothetical protein
MVARGAQRGTGRRIGGRGCGVAGWSRRTVVALGPSRTITGGTLRHRIDGGQRGSGRGSARGVLVDRAGGATCRGRSGGDDGCADNETTESGWFDVPRPLPSSSSTGVVGADVAPPRCCVTTRARAAATKSSREEASSSTAGRKVLSSIIFSRQRARQAPVLRTRLLRCRGDPPTLSSLRTGVGSSGSSACANRKLNLCLRARESLRRRRARRLRLAFERRLGAAGRRGVSN